MLSDFVRLFVEIILLFLAWRSVTMVTMFNMMVVSNVNLTVKYFVPNVFRMFVTNAVLLVGNWQMIFVTQFVGMVCLFIQNNVMMPMMRCMMGVMNVNFNVSMHATNVKMVYALIVSTVGR